MKAFTQFEALVAPLDRANVDTDAIIPKQFLKSIRRSGFGQNLFDGWRFLDEGQPGQDCAARPRNPDFVLNDARYAGAGILLCRENFGCGSSREHAPWALEDFGFRVLIGSSFADIFYNNCFKNGLLPVVLAADVVDALFDAVIATPGYRLAVDLAEQTVTTPAGAVHRFDVEPFRKHCLLNGLDDIGITLTHSDRIARYEASRAGREPWIFDDRPAP